MIGTPQISLVITPPDGAWWYKIFSSTIFGNLIFSVGRGEIWCNLQILTKVFKVNHTRGYAVHGSEPTTSLSSTVHCSQTLFWYCHLKVFSFREWNMSIELDECNVKPSDCRKRRRQYDGQFHGRVLPYFRSRSRVQLRSAEP